MNPSTVPPAMRMLPVGLVVVAEAAWIAMLGGLIEEYALRPAALGVVELAAFVLVGVAAGRVLGRRLPPSRWAIVAVVLVGVGAVAGILVSPVARAALAIPGSNVGAALASHPAGVVAGLAILRGYRHAEWPMDEDGLGRLFVGGAIVAVFAAVAGSLIAEPWRSSFLDDTLRNAVVFAITSILGLALTRQAAAGFESDQRWTPNASWIGLVIVIVAITGLAVVPAETIATPIVELLAYIALMTLLGVGLVLGWTRRTAFGLIAVVAFFSILGTVLRMMQPDAGAPGGGAGGGAAGGAAGGSSGEAGAALPVDILYGLAIVILALMVGGLVWWWARGRRARPSSTIVETRFIDRSRRDEARPSGGWLPRLGVRGRPSDAAGAYVALVRDLAGKPGVERLATETPHEHAHRLRTSGTPTLALELLAADYALVRYGGLSLTTRETRRAIDRCRGLRVRLAARSEELLRTAVAIEAEKTARDERLDRESGQGVQPGDTAPPSATQRG